MKKAINDIKISKSGKSNTCTISIEGELTVNNITAIRQEWLKALEKCESLQLRIHDVTTLDLSWIQLFHSLKKTCDDLGKSTAIEMLLNHDVELLLARTGFGSLLESSKSNNQTIR